MLLLKGELLLMILNHGCADRAVEIARNCGATGGTVMKAQGTATKGVLAALGLGSSAKDLVFFVMDGKTASSVTEAVSEDRKINGVSAVIGGSKESDMDSKWKMITVIANSGYSEDIMDAARKAGATGGTIVNARGTASPGDSKFMGITIVPEKEMVLILSEKDGADAIVKAISELKCLENRGSGIIFTQDVTDFKLIGKQK